MIAALTILVSRRRSKIAMWVLFAFFALGLAGIVHQMKTGQLLGSGIISVVQLIGQLGAFGLLFAPRDAG